MLLALRIVGFVIVSIIACVLLPFLALQQPLVFVLLVAVFLFMFARAFAPRKSPK
jgi:membrane protein implicated in regulation of membrane protease activity